jgi:hypothetical protein
MTVVSEMLRTHPKGVGELDESVLKNCILACLECVYSCTACADACLSEDMVADLRDCIQKNLDCADVCDATAKVLSRHPGATSNELLISLLQACRAMCHACAVECEQHADMHLHCEVCAKTCRRCVDACDELLAALEPVE